MKAIYKGHKFSIVWNIINRSTQQPFDFTGLNVSVGLYSDSCRTSLQSYNIENGTITAEIEANSLPTGVYNLICRYANENEQAYCIYRNAFQITLRNCIGTDAETVAITSAASHIDSSSEDDMSKECQLIAEELFGGKFKLPQLTADRAISDEHGNRISDTYVTRSSVEGHIKQIYNQQFIENPPLITEGYITPEMLSEETREMLEATGQSITNLPDGEDLQAVHGVLKLANKKYNPNSFSGLGRQYLRKNIVAGVNVLTQSMMQWPNTIYIIQYDYDLQGKEITIPAGCMLDFQGGSLSNGTINGNNTYINAKAKKIFTDISLSGNYVFDKAYVEWFGAVNGLSSDSTWAIQKTIDTFKTAYLRGDYLVTTILIRTENRLEGSSKCNLVSYEDNSPVIALVGGARYSRINGVTVICRGSRGEENRAIQLNEGACKNSFKNINISGCHTAIYGVNNVWQNLFENIQISQIDYGIVINNKTGGTIMNKFSHIYIGEHIKQAISLLKVNTSIFENINIGAEKCQTTVINVSTSKKVSFINCNIEAFGIEVASSTRIIDLYDSVVIFDKIYSTDNTLKDTGDSFVIQCYKSHIDVYNSTLNAKNARYGIALLESTCSLNNSESTVRGENKKINSYHSYGSSSEFPISGLSVGFIYYNTETGKPVYYNGSEWLNFDGTVVGNIIGGEIIGNGGIIYQSKSIAIKKGREYIVRVNPNTWSTALPTSSATSAFSVFTKDASGAKVDTLLDIKESEFEEVNKYYIFKVDNDESKELILSFRPAKGVKIKYSIEEI